MHSHVQQFVNRYTIPELRALLEDAKNEIVAADAFEENDFGWWQEHALLLKKAIALRQQQSAYYPGLPTNPKAARHIDPEILKERCDIVAIVERHLPLKREGSHFKACCPFHSEKTASFVIFPDQNTWHCFGACNQGGDVIDFVMRIDGLSFGEAVRRLCSEVGLTWELRPNRPPRITADL